MTGEKNGIPPGNADDSRNESPTHNAIGSGEENPENNLISFSEDQETYWRVTEALLWHTRQVDRAFAILKAGLDRGVGVIERANLILAISQARGKLEQAQADYLAFARLHDGEQFIPFRPIVADVLDRRFDRRARLAKKRGA